MPPVYTTINSRGEFTAFWKHDERTISFFLPDDMHEKYQTGDLEKWKSDIFPYYERVQNTAGLYEDLKKYDDLINAAWHFLGQQLIMIDKGAVSISKQEPGKFYPRIWRGRYIQNLSSNYNAVDARLVYGYKHVQSVVATSSLFDYLIEIFRHIEPHKDNSGAFGHKIRELIILACTEIESAWRAVLEENTAARKPSYSTKDYIRINEPLNLGKWRVALKDYPDLDALAPFEAWSGSSPTKSLPWYDAYNAVKHHREANFQQATLTNLLNAMAALHIMHAAQWGPEIFSKFFDDISSPYWLLDCPVYEADEIYMPSLDEKRSLAPTLYFDR